MNNETIRAYHFLNADMTAGRGTEPPWKIGESRTYDGPIVLCKSGYHSSPTLWDALEYAPGPMACLVEISVPVDRDETKLVSTRRKLIKSVNIEKGLRLFAADCAERVLWIFEREYPADRRPRLAIQAARDFAHGRIDAQQLAAAGAARDAAGAAWAAAWAARDAAGAAWDAAGAAAWAAEIKWQKEHFDQMFGGIFQ